MKQNQTELIVKALAKHMGIIQVADCYAVGENDGGLFVSLFNSNLGFRIGTVYQERFKDLPDFIDTDDPAGEISTERSRLEKKGYLKQCPAFGFTRYQAGNHDDEKTPWRFGDVLWVSKSAPVPTNGTQPSASQNGAPAPEPTRYSLRQPPVLDTKEEAYEWAVGVGAYVTIEQAKGALVRLYNDRQPQDWPALRTIWIGHVNQVANNQVRLAAHAPPQEVAA